MADARDEFLRHKEQALAARREGRPEEARVHFLAAAKALLALAEKVKSHEEKASLIETANALVAKARELKTGSPEADLVAIEPDVSTEAPREAPPVIVAPPAPSPAEAIDPSVFLASSPGQEMRAQILRALASVIPLSPAVDLAALAAETNGLSGPDLLALLAEALRRARTACVKGRVEWRIEPEDVAGALAQGLPAPSASDASCSARRNDSSP